MKYKRILLKMSGEALAGHKKHGIDGQIIGNFAQEVIKVMEAGVQGGHRHRRG